MTRPNSLRPHWQRPISALLAATILGTSALAVFGADDLTVRKEFVVKEGGRLELDVDRGAVRVVSGATDHVVVEVQRTLKSGSDKARQEAAGGHHVEIDESGGTVKVRGRTDGDGWIGGWNKKRLQVSYWVTVPPRFNLNLQTGGGSVEVGDLEGQVSVRTGGGSIQVGRIRGDVEATSGGGSVRLTSATGTTRVRTGGGSIHLRGGGGVVTASTGGGSIEARFDSPPGAGSRISTGGGSVAVELPGQAGFELDASTGGGGVRCDFAVDGVTKRDRVRGKVNGGGGLLTVRSGGGSVAVRKAP